MLKHLEEEEGCFDTENNLVSSCFVEVRKKKQHSPFLLCHLITGETMLNNYTVSLSLTSSRQSIFLCGFFLPVYTFYYFFQQCCLGTLSSTISTSINPSSVPSADLSDAAGFSFTSR